MISPAKIRKTIRARLLRAGWSVMRGENLPTGIDWAHDLRRRVPRLVPRMVFDVGANVGQTSRWLAEAYSEATIHAFEPIPGTFERLTQAAAALPRVTPHQLAVSDEPGSMTVQAIPNAPRNSLKTGVFDGHPEAQPVEVQVGTLDRFCAERGIASICVLKTDTEGNDAAVLDGARGLLAAGAISAVVSEVTFDPQNPLQTQFDEVWGRLREQGFLVCSLYETETLFRTEPNGGFCNALFVHRSLLETQA